MDPFGRLRKFALERDEGEDNSENMRFDSLYIINWMDYMDYISPKGLSGMTRDCMEYGTLMFKHKGSPTWSHFTVFPFSRPAPIPPVLLAPLPIV